MEHARRQNGNFQITFEIACGYFNKCFKSIGCKWFILEWRSQSLCICTNFSKVKIPLRRLDKEYDQYLLHIFSTEKKILPKPYQVKNLKNLVFQQRQKKKITKYGCPNRGYRVLASLLNEIPVITEITQHISFMF